jgi:hypothetical protein
MALAARTVQNMADRWQREPMIVFVACFYDARTDEELLRAELRVAHAFLVVIKVVGFGTDFSKSSGLSESMARSTDTWVVLPNLFRFTVVSKRFWRRTRLRRGIARSLKKTWRHTRDWRIHPEIDRIYGSEPRRGGNSQLGLKGIANSRHTRSKEAFSSPRRTDHSTRRPRSDGGI